ncbi:hypothetical protein EJB05_05688, partial [Eragrostis curvula]
MATPARAGISAAAGDDVASTDLLQVLRHITSAPDFRSTVASASSNGAAWLTSHGPLSPVLPMAGPARPGISAAAGDDLQVLSLTIGSPNLAFRSVAPTAAASPTFRDLPERLLLNILGRLPCRSCLFSASFVCRSWRAAISSTRNRPFLREFFASRSPPLLGFFFQRSLPEPAFFHPAAVFDPIVADVLAQGDFFLDHIPQPLESGEFMSWEIMDCQSGYLLLSWPETGDLMVYNPLSGYQRNIGSPQFVHHIGTYDLHLAVSSEGPFSIMCVYHTNGSTAQLSVFRFGDRWRLFGQIETAEPWSGTHRRAVQSGNILFWPFLDREQMFAVDMVDEEAAFIDIPAQGIDFVVALAGDGHLSLLSAVGSSLCIWKRELDRAHETHMHLSLFSVHHGLVYLCALQAMQSPYAPWVVFSFCLRSREIRMGIIAFGANFCGVKAHRDTMLGWRRNVMHCRWILQEIGNNGSIADLLDAFDVLARNACRSCRLNSEAFSILKVTEAANKVSTWMKNVPSGQLPTSFDQTTRLVIGNALYFEGACTEKFDASKSEDRHGELFFINGSLVKESFISSTKAQFDPLVCSTNPLVNGWPGYAYMIFKLQFVYGLSHRLSAQGAYEVVDVYMLFTLHCHSFVPMVLPL